MSRSALHWGWSRTSPEHRSRGLVLGAVLCLVLLPAPAVADRFCEALWFSRNAILDAAGQCFVTPLGQALFDNTDCTGSNPTLSAADVARIKDLNAWAWPDCDVDTGAEALDLFDIETRRKLIRHPLPDDTESACIDWQGDALPLRAGPAADARVIGQVKPGDTILYSWQAEDGWDYIETGRAGGLGWLWPGDVDLDRCGMLAG